ncbi:hypothetical protein H5P28_11160 [Ruficoccus amylovorans]|uniref:Uncharacterized protein n=1 Tax=Ruficoccus amylovorans TaxID=1804625 RepID=A0A842HFK0_9BACT|nr:hypothetical protein [Ruficoccus amylovorans]MBC2594818.1 hypothetical protein [Ruficoccus amylovorans]
MTASQLREWQFVHSLPDQWFYQIDQGEPLGPVTLDTVEELAAGHSESIRIHHISQQGANPPWVSLKEQGESNARTRLPATCPQCKVPLSPGYEIVRVRKMDTAKWFFFGGGVFLCFLAWPFGVFIGLPVCLYALLAKVNAEVPIWRCKNCKQTYSRNNSFGRLAPH